MTLFAIGAFGWIWAISVKLNSQLPENVKLNLKFFKGMFLVPAIYIGLILIGLILTFFGVKVDGLELHPSVAFVFILIHLFSMVVIFLSISFAAKTLKSIELQRSVKFGDYAGEFFLIWFSIIGYWVLQPRINALLERKEG
jgi:membrane protein CcdC involved in cytochrome C biogenesis